MKISKTFASVNFSFFFLQEVDRESEKKIGTIRASCGARKNPGRLAK